MGCTKEADSSDYLATHKAEPSASQSNQDATGDPVNVVTGAFTLSEQDLAIPVGRLALVFTRHYNSQRHEADPTHAPGPFGRGWTHSFHLYLEPGPEAGDITYIDDQGTSLVFRRSDSGGFVPPPGALGLELTPLATGGYHLRQIDGLIAEFDANGRLVALVRQGPADDSRIVLTYDALHRLIEIMGRGGRCIRLDYRSTEPLITAVKDHTGRRWEYHYTPRQELAEVRDPAGRVRRYTYGEWQGWVTKKIADEGDKNKAKGQTELRTIHALHKVLRYASTRDNSPPAVELTNTYTSERRVDHQIDAHGNVTKFDYNCFTRNTFVTDPAGWSTVYSYDEAGNTTKVRKPSGGTTEYIFDDQRNLIAEVDPLGNCTQYVEVRDPKHLERKREFGRRALGNRSAYVTLSSTDIQVGYDTKGNRPLVRDPLGHTTHFHDYNRFGRPSRISFPDGSEVRYEYDERSGLPTRMAQT
jgi:YD repeat-containing protein